MLELIEAYMRSRRIAPTRFGREAVGDPNLVTQLREGRVLRERTVRRVQAYLEQKVAQR